MDHFFVDDVIKKHEQDLEKYKESILIRKILFSSIICFSLIGFSIPLVQDNFVPKIILSIFIILIFIASQLSKPKKPVFKHADLEYVNDIFTRIDRAKVNDTIPCAISLLGTNWLKTINWMVDRKKDRDLSYDLIYFGATPTTIEFTINK